MIQKNCEVRPLLLTKTLKKKINENNLYKSKQYYLKMEVIFINTENSRRNECHNPRLTLADKCNLKDPNKNILLANLTFYYLWKYRNI